MNAMLYKTDVQTRHGGTIVVFGLPKGSQHHFLKSSQASGERENGAKNMIDMLIEQEKALPATFGTARRTALASWRDDRGAKN